MKLHNNKSSDQGVSPVVGVILLVAIVVLICFVATMVLISGAIHALNIGISFFDAALIFAVWIFANITTLVGIHYAQGFGLEDFDEETLVHEVVRKISAFAIGVTLVHFLFSVSVDMFATLILGLLALQTFLRVLSYFVVDEQGEDEVEEEDTDKTGTTSDQDDQNEVSEDRAEESATDDETEERPD